jgi:hypothetical protein
MSMQFIAHRRNSAAELAQTPKEYGAEIDLRSIGARLVLQHDPYVDGEEFETWLRGFGHGTLILNVKEEGLEGRLLSLMSQHRIDDFFLLDQSFPFLIKTARGGERRCAVRVSEYESMHTVMSLAGLVDWVWIDSFQRFPLTRSELLELHQAGFRTCLVSPELQGRREPQEIAALARQFEAWGVEPTAVCSKLEFIPAWKGALESHG